MAFETANDFGRKDTVEQRTRWIVVRAKIMATVEFGAVFGSLGRFESGLKKRVANGWRAVRQR
jgi:hypothetical protein